MSTSYEENKMHWLNWRAFPQLDIKLQRCFGGSNAVNYTIYSMRTYPGAIGAMQKCRPSTSTVGSAAVVLHFFGYQKRQLSMSFDSNWFYYNRFSDKGKGKGRRRGLASKYTQWNLFFE